MPPRTDLLVVGDTAVDFFLKLTDASVQRALDPRHCLLCLRYADKIPVEAVARVLPAGNAANTAVGAARLGLRSGLVTVVGRDAAGREITAALRRRGVGLAYVQKDPRRGTNISVVLNFRGERTILVFHERRAYALPRLAPARFLYLTSLGEGWESIVPPLRRALAKSGARLAFNPGTYQLRSPARNLHPLLRVTAILLVNRAEAAILLHTRANLPPRILLRRLRTLGPETVVITDGPEGAYVLHEEDGWFMPPFPLPAVERTGAGDAFSTGFLAALLYGQSFAEALRWGTANAGSVIRFVGPQEGLLTRADLRRVLARYPRLVPRKLAD